MNKINEWIKRNFLILLYSIIIVQPLIDIAIGIFYNYPVLSFVLSLMRIFILSLLVYYVLFVEKSKNKKYLYIMFGIVAIYLLIFAINMQFNIYEIKMAIKVFYFPIFLMLILYIKNENKEFSINKYLLIDLFLYSFIIIFAYITKSAFKSYEITKFGASGYFRSANEIGNIFAIILPFVFNYVFQKVDFKKIAYFIVIVVAIFILGTKTPVISLIICTIYYVLNLINKKNLKRILLFTILALMVFTILIPRTPIYKNIKIHFAYLEIKSVKEFFEKPDLIDHFVMGSRIKFLKENNTIYKESSVSQKLVGIGYEKNPKLSEMDLFDIFYRQGILGTVVYLSIIIYFIYNFKIKIKKENLLSLVMILLVTIFVGHAITAPSVSIFIGFIIMEMFDNKNKNYNKIGHID